MFFVFVQAHSSHVADCNFGPLGTRRAGQDGVFFRLFGGEVDVLGGRAAGSAKLEGSFLDVGIQLIGVDIEEVMGVVALHHN